MHLIVFSFLAMSAAAQDSPVRVSGESPYPADCNGRQSGVNYRNGEVEPWVAADSTDPHHFIGVWQQDRWSNGGASGLVSAASFDSGATWKIAVPRFTRCAGGDYERASDPWVTIAADGTAYFLSLSFNAADSNKAVLVSRSADGGVSWSDPVALISDSSRDVNDDKPSITADPKDANTVYAVWDRTSGLTAKNPVDSRAPVWFSRTTDGGQTWEPARIIYDPGPDAQTIGNQIVVLADGTLVNLLTLTLNASGQYSPMFEAVIRSTDKGVTWSDVILISLNLTVGVPGVRTGNTMASIAADPMSGALYCAWHDARFSFGKRNGIALSKSLDGGLTWSEPVQVNQALEVAAFSASIAVHRNGTIGITYFDLRNGASYWRIISSDGGASWQESLIAGPIDLNAAPRDGKRPFLGDYHGLVSRNDSFLAFFVSANTANTINPSDVYAK
jgi:hypothetical protein